MDRSSLKAISVSLSLAVISTSAFGQFKKFKSKPRFNNKKVENNGPQANPFAGQADANTQTFGSRNGEVPAGPEKSKYVQLNPETAFGPEIVTSFDFPDADIMEVTKHMQKLTGLNLLLDKEVKGKISISAPNPITVGDAWRAYLAALNMVNLTIVKTGAFYKIINVRDIRYVPTKVYTGSYTPDTEQHVMKVISLKNVDANEISRNFRPFMSRYGRIIDLKQTNTVIISDTGANISRLEKLIKFVDVPGHEESLQIIAVQNTSAQEIAKLLDEILKSNSSSSRTSTRRSSSSSRFSSSSKSKNQNISKIIAEPRTNSIIAMANAEGAKQLRNLLKKLDVRSASTNADKIHVHYLNFGNAEELAKTLSNLVSGASNGSKNSRSGSRNFIPKTSDGSTLFNGEVKVTADKNNNALVVTASATDWLTLKNVIKKLDIPRDQVYVEGMIVETTINKARAFGTEYYGALGTGAVERAGFTAGGGIADLIQKGGTSLNGFFGGFGLGKEVEIDIPGSTNKVTVNSVNGLIKAIATNENSNVLATPQILALDNTEAEFSVGTTVPVEQSTTTNGTIQKTVVDKEAKLSLKITPQINKVTRFIKLKIDQSINDFRGELKTDGKGAITDTRSAITEIMVKDRDTIAMGGLLRDRESVNYNKVPLLGDIPVLGWLFKSKSKVVEKRNLLFFLTPRIISPEDNTARENTLGKIREREEHLKNTLSEGQKLPYKKAMDKIEQTAGPGEDMSFNSDGAPNYKEIAGEKEI